MSRYEAVLFGATVIALLAPGGHARQVPEAAKQAYEKGDYSKAIALLKEAADKEPANGDIHLLLTKSYLEDKKYEEAVKAGEKAVADDPKSSVYHQWLGEAYGQKADHASALSAYGLARKTQKEFEIAVQLDERNFDAAQDLVDYDCTAPGMVGGGEDKAQPLIQKLMGMDAAEGHFAAGACREAKKDMAAADAEYARALESTPKTAERLFEIGDYFAGRNQGDKEAEVAVQGEKLAAKDPREKYYRAVASILKGESRADAEKLLREYLEEAPLRSTNPGPWEAHYWLGRYYEVQKDATKAKDEYREALKLNPKYKRAQEALKQAGQ
jgi:tetratricopeptide (TPR) repeat protein